MKTTGESRAKRKNAGIRETDKSYLEKQIRVISFNKWKMRRPFCSNTFSNIRSTYVFKKKKRNTKKHTKRKDLTNKGKEKEQQKRNNTKKAHHPLHNSKISFSHWSTTTDP